MVGFTELASRVDPEVLQGIVRSYEDTCAAAVTRFEGYVFQRLGDGIVAFFGFRWRTKAKRSGPIRAGLEIIEALSKLDVPDAGHLAVRIGIATGLVVVSSAEKGAVGETMNLAARLQAIAQPGSIVVSEPRAPAGRRRFDYADLGEHSSEGYQRAHACVSYPRAEPGASRFEAATGASVDSAGGARAGDRAAARSLAIAHDGEGQVVLLSGEPGIGKSRMLTALRERLSPRGRAGALACSARPITSTALSIRSSSILSASSVRAR